MAKPLLVMRLVNLTINFDIMLYLIESGIYAKIGYTSDNETLEKRLNSYQTHNPSFRLLDTAEGSEEDEKRLQALYKDYKANSNTEWSYTKKLVIKIWVDYRASIENVEYYTEFGIKPNNIIEYGKIENMDNLLKALNDNLITDKEVDLYTEFRDYYERYTEQSASLNEIIR